METANTSAMHTGNHAHLVTSNDRKRETRSQRSKLAFLIFVVGFREFVQFYIIFLDFFYDLQTWIYALEYLLYFRKMRNKQ